MNNTPEPGDRAAYFGRVSTPKQKLEHQRETVERWCERKGVLVPLEFRFEDKIRRHEAASVFRDWEKRKRNTSRKRYRFDDLMTLVEAGQLDWIIIASFDRWGISDRDEIFVFRSKLREYGVQLYSVVDELNITSADETGFLHVAFKAVAATGYVTQQAEKNIQKMVSMAEGGWATTGNAPFGIDLVLYSLADLTRPIWRVVRTRFKPHQYRVIYYEDSSRVQRDENGFITQAKLKVEREVSTNNMPPRDKKTTGYRYEPSVETRRLDAVRQLFELYDGGLEFGAISETLWGQGLGHYGKPFGYHGVESILSNSAYVGRPAWGKLGVGEYRIAVDKMPKPVRRKKDDTLVVKKSEDQFIYPTKPVFPNVVPQDLFDRVKKKLAARPHVNDTFGKRRTRDKATHPLNGKVICPDCEAPMVLGSFMPGKKSRGKRFRCFHCGTWRKTIRTKCNANTVRWELLDQATDTLLKAVADRIGLVQTGKPSSLIGEEWLRKTDLGRTLLHILWTLNGEDPADLSKPLSDEEKQEPAPELPELDELFEKAKRGEIKNPKEALIDVLGHLLGGGEGLLDDPDIATNFSEQFEEYDRQFEAKTAALKSELAEINDELDAIAAELPLQRKKNPSMAERLDRRAAELGRRRAEIEPRLVPLTEKARATMAQLGNIRETIEAADKTKLAQLLDGFVERVYPVFEVQQVGKAKKRRAIVTGFRFVPRETAMAVLPNVMEVGISRTGTGSSTRTARSRRGTWTDTPPG